MFKRKTLAGILTLATSLSASSAFAWWDPNTVYLPELNRDVHVQRNANTKEFSADYRDLIDVRFKLIEPFDTGICSEWRKAVKIADKDTDASFYKRSKMRLQLQALQVNSAAIDNAVGSDWSDVGNLEITKIAIQYQWESAALMSMAGINVKDSTLQDIEDQLNSVSSR